MITELTVLLLYSVHCVDCSSPITIKVYTQECIITDNRLTEITTRTVV